MPNHDYEKFAKAYSNLEIKNSFYLAYKETEKLIKQYARGKKALDYGCGGGRSTRFLKSLGFSSVGVDISEDMIREARSRDEAGEYAVIESGIISYPDESFDLVLSSIVFLEIPSKEEMLKVTNEMKRVLKKDGAIIVITGAEGSQDKNWSSFIQDFPENKNLNSGERAKLMVRGTDIVLYDYVWSDEDHEDVFKEAGLKPLDTRKPLATGEEPFKWYSEMEHPVWVIYVLKK